MSRLSLGSLLAMMASRSGKITPIDGQEYTLNFKIMAIMAMAIMTVAIMAMAMIASRRGKITPIDGQEKTFEMLAIMAIATMAVAIRAMMPIMEIAMVTRSLPSMVKNTPL